MNTQQVSRANSMKKWCDYLIKAIQDDNELDIVRCLDHIDQLLHQIRGDCIDGITTES
jgi:hypothetical protein